MIFRRFVETLCYVSNEEITVKAAFSLLKVAIGADHVQTIFLNKDSEKLMKSYMRSNRNLPKSVAKEIREAFNETSDNRKELKESLCEQCFCNKERIARTKEAFGQYCPDLLNMEKIKVLKKEGSELLVNLFIDMLKKAESGYREKTNCPAQQSEAKQNDDSISLQQATDSSNTADIQNDISTDLPDVLSAVEKEDIEHYCGLINSSLQNIKRQAEALERKQREINDLAFVLENTLPKNSHSRKIWHRQKVKVLWKPDRKWKIPNPEWVKAKRRYKDYQENESKKLIENADSNYNQLEKYCRKMTHQLINKQDLDPSIKAIYEIIQKIGDKKYKATTPETFSYSALSLLVSDYQNRYRRLLIFIQGK